MTAEDLWVACADPSLSPAFLYGVILNGPIILLRTSPVSGSSFGWPRSGANLSPAPLLGLIRSAHRRKAGFMFARPVRNSSVLRLALRRLRCDVCPDAAFSGNARPGRLYWRTHRRLQGRMNHVACRPVFHLPGRLSLPCTFNEGQSPRRSKATWLSVLSACPRRCRWSGHGRSCRSSRPGTAYRRHTIQSSPLGVVHRRHACRYRRELAEDF